MGDGRWVDCGEGAGVRTMKKLRQLFLPHLLYVPFPYPRITTHDSEVTENGLMQT
jgi:hypothetical protein